MNMLSILSVKTRPSKVTIAGQPTFESRITAVRQDGSKVVIKSTPWKPQGEDGAHCTDVYDTFSHDYTETRKEYNYTDEVWEEYELPVDTSLFEVDGVKYYHAYGSVNMSLAQALEHEGKWQTFHDKDQQEMLGLI